MQFANNIKRLNGKPLNVFDPALCLLQEVGGGGSARRGGRAAVSVANDCSIPGKCFTHFLKEITGFLLQHDYFHIHYFFLTSLKIDLP